MTWQSWGRVSQPMQFAVALSSRSAALPNLEAHASSLAYGLGRSYGDSCLNEGQQLLLTRQLSRFMDFDASSGVFTCESGVSLAEILAFAVPQGWFLPVTPGTRFVTVGGAVANDVHGKNHHQDGTFGHAVLGFELLRSDGQRLYCSPKQNTEMFIATIGGLGLTGLITWVTIQLLKVPGQLIDQEVIKCGSLADFFALSEESAAQYQYTVAWLDCLAAGASLGRGLYIRGNHCADVEPRPRPPRELQVPFECPGFTLNKLTIKAFNELYFRKQLHDRTRSVVDYHPFFYPLDGVHHWPRIYGKRGFYQYQCVVPFSAGDAAIRALLSEIAKSGLGSFLSVLKTFGAKPSLGYLSFARPGVTVALDFPNVHGVLPLFERLDALTLEAGGVVYPAKDQRMSASTFQRYYPQWESFKQWCDPRFSSCFWRRVTQA